MNNEQLLAEIREANLTYLMLAQTLIRQDKAEAVFRLGLNEESCDLLAALSAAQVLKLASRNTLLASFRVDDEMVWSLLTNHSSNKIGNGATNTLHANILMASRVSESSDPPEELWSRHVHPRQKCPERVQADRARRHAHRDGCTHAGARIRDTLSYERLIRLYKEIAGKVAFQGPAAVLDRLVPDLAGDIHSSLFLNIYEYLSKGARAGCR